MERDGREAVVFDVEGHLPSQQAKGAVRIGRACIGKHVVAQRAARMLGHEEQPKERLPGEHGDRIENLPLLGGTWLRLGLLAHDPEL